MAQDAYGDSAHLHAIFHPATIAIVGPAGPRTLGERTLRSLTAAGVERPIFIVDAGARHDASEACAYRDLTELPRPIDLAIIVTAGDETLDAIERCVAAGVRGIVVQSHLDGSLERRRDFGHHVRDRLRRSRTKLIGPGCEALMNPSLGLNISAGLPMPVAGNLAFIAQSGSLASAIIDWSHRGIVGFSAFVSVGDMVDVGWGNLIDYFGDDPSTAAILIHMESITNMRSFLSAARAVALRKPIIVTKAGRTHAAAAAFPWHRSPQVTDDDVFDAALRRVGVIRADYIEDLFYVADALSKQSRPSGPRLTIVTNAGTAGVLTADHAVHDATLVPLPHDRAEETADVESLETWRPLDVLGDGTSQPFLAAVEKASRTVESDATLVVFVPQAMSDPARAIDGLLAMDTTRKPLLLCVPGPSPIPAEQEVLLRACLPLLSSIRAAVRTFGYLWRYTRDLKAIYETPELHADAADRQQRQRASALIANALQARRGRLTAAESREVLTHYGIASEPFDGRTGAHSVPHRGYELQIGSRVDREFGPVLWLDVGGQWSDLLHARVTGLPPLTATLARRMLERSPMFEGLQRLAMSHDISLAALDATLVRVSQLIVEQPSIRELSIDPLLISADGAFAAGADIALHDADRPEERPSPAFRPFPVRYVSSWTTRQGLPITIRPIRAEDEPLMVDFHGQLSESAVYFRYAQVVKLARRTAHDQLTRDCFVDYDREMVLVAEERGASAADRRILATAQLTKLPRRNHGEVAVLVTDRYQRHGIGQELVRCLVEVARDERLDRVVAYTRADNQGMCTVFSRLGFTLSVDGDDVKAELDLGGD